MVLVLRPHLVLRPARDGRVVVMVVVIEHHHLITFDSHTLYVTSLKHSSSYQFGGKALFSGYNHTFAPQGQRTAQTHFCCYPTSETAFIGAKG